ncbi:TetR/AcrR family transcriptional regulator [Massilia sp. BJB1822]|uniref:TetR/AcrR family transcriptional regulator n=1 Tax=Massilia sp. BJB1822 TaxID=2744470 RepID=UPI001592E3D0|nr:TetR/AcrR family transcriptional regulator [Massilia sp. BJB1822]NVD99300.1 TetR/AcrR family transcriptional regulator [Massilia sp. BJB1822]
MKKRMSAESRREQLMDCALELVREEGANALTLARVAERAGVSKPIAYEHFQTREGLLAALYTRYCEQHLALTGAALAQAQDGPQAATVLAQAYIDCVLSSDAASLAVEAAMHGAAETEAVMRRNDDAYLAFCAARLAVFVPGKPCPADLIAFLGALRALAQAVAAGTVAKELALARLSALLLAAWRE